MDGWESPVARLRRALGVLLLPFFVVSLEVGELSSSSVFDGRCSKDGARSPLGQVAG